MRFGRRRWIRRKPLSRRWALFPTDRTRAPEKSLQQRRRRCLVRCRTTRLLRMSQHRTRAVRPIAKTICLPLYKWSKATILGCSVPPGAFTGKTTKSVVQLEEVRGVVTSKLNFAGYMAGAVPATPRLILQSRCSAARALGLRCPGSRPCGGQSGIRRRQPNIARGSFAANCMARMSPKLVYTRCRVVQSWNAGTGWAAGFTSWPESDADRAAARQTVRETKHLRERRGRTV